MFRLDQRTLTGLATPLLLLAVAACDRDMQPEPTAPEEAVLPQQAEAESPPPAAREAEPAASAELEAAEGTEIDGEARFFSSTDGVRIVLEVEDAPAGKKGVHIHEKGDCSDIEGESMGSHFAPEGDKHALPDEEAPGVRHLGDLGNIEIGDDGKGRLEATIPGATLQEGDGKSFLGKALVVHSGTDSGKAQQPSGASGTPMACGVIKSS